jgi:hypothetical protein
MVSWFAADGTVVARASAPKAALHLTPNSNVGIRFDWHDDTLLWGETITDSTGLHNTLHVTTFR